MRYLVEIKTEHITNGGNYLQSRKSIQLESKAELAELIQILPGNMLILSVEQRWVYDNLNDFKAELLKNNASDLEMGKISQKPLTKHA